MRKCGQCGGRLRRVHRTFLERFSYMAIYACRDCKKEEFIPRRFRYHLGEACRCPRCGTFRVIRLKERDRIDPLHKGFLHWIEKRAGGRLHHCRWCRLQFYDRRKLASEIASQAPPVEHKEVAPPGTATSDV
jgi:hypothetical protein